MVLQRILLVLNHIFFVVGKDVEGNSPSALKDETPQTPNFISKVLWNRETFPFLLSFLLRMLLIILTLFLKVIEKASAFVSAGTVCAYFEGKENECFCMVGMTRKPALSSGLFSPITEEPGLFGPHLAV